LVGTLRRHLVTNSGRRRDSVYFSVIEEEWPRVRQHLEARLARHGAG
jgi:RimJ/RimL family protein N-acetyltransferase